MTGVELFAIAGTAVTVGDAMLVIGAATTVMGMAQQRKAEQQQANFNAAVARNNAIAIAHQRNAELDRFDREERLRRGDFVTQTLANGVRLEGTPVDVMTDDEIESDLERRMIIYNADLEMRNAQAQGALFQNKAQNAFAGFGTAAAGTLLTAGSKVGSKKSTGGTLSKTSTRLGPGETNEFFGG